MALRPGGGSAAAVLARLGSGGDLDPPDACEDAGPASPDADSGADSQRWSYGWRRPVRVAGMLVYPAVTAVGVSQSSMGWRAVAGFAIVSLFCGCFVALSADAVGYSRSQAGPELRVRPRFWLLLGTMTALFLAALPVAQGAAVFLGAVIISIAAAVMRRRAALIVTVGAIIGAAVPLVEPTWHNGPGWFGAPLIIFTAMAVCSFVDITRTNHALMAARAEVARLASEAERNRIARDLHDLLGHSLTAITVKSGLARRLAAADDQAGSAREIAEVEQLCRQALTDVRAAVSGIGEVTLAGELARGRELLRACGVIADLPTACDVVDSAYRELFGWAVREGLTNVARHAHATRCTVTLSASRVEIRDDGVGGPGGRGHGLAGLRERAAALGGSVQAGPAGPRGWQLCVRLDAGGVASP